MYRGVESLCKLLTVNKVLFDLATNDSIANTSVKTPLNFRAEKRSAQVSAHPLSQAQGGLFCVLT